MKGCVIVKYVEPVRAVCCMYVRKSCREGVPASDVDCVDLARRKHFVQELLLGWQGEQRSCYASTFGKVDTWCIRQ